MNRKKEERAVRLELSICSKYLFLYAKISRQLQTYSDFDSMT